MIRVFKAEGLLCACALPARIDRCCSRQQTSSVGGRTRRDRAAGFKGRDQWTNSERLFRHDRGVGGRERSRDPPFEENLAFIQTTFRENSRVISTLTRLLQTPYSGWNYSLTPITPALLRLDPFWDPLRADPDFQKLCEEKQN